MGDQVGREIRMLRSRRNPSTHTVHDAAHDADLFIVFVHLDGRQTGEDVRIASRCEQFVSLIEEIILFAWLSFRGFAG